MSDAIKELHDYLAESPSVVYPQDVLEYLPAIEAENAKLRTSIGIRETCNARLREDLEDQEGYDQMLRDRLRQQTELCVKAEADNAKLRELVTDMYRCSDPCNDCQHYSGSNTGYYCGLGIGWKARRMRELGIEVDG